MTENTHSYTRRLLLFALLTLLAGAFVIVGYVVVMSSKAAGQVPSPPRQTVHPMPDESGGRAYERITFTTSDGIEIAGWYVPSENGAAVILAHGYGGNRTQMLNQAEMLSQAGYGVLLFDFRAHGESGGEMVTLGDAEQKEVRAAVDVLIARPEVEPGRIGGVGISMGAAALTHVAAVDERLQAVVLEAVFPTLRGAADHQARLLGPFSRIPTRITLRRAGLDLDAVRPVDVICDISPRPVLLIYGSEDPVVPPGSAMRMREAACPPAEMWEIAGASHGNASKTVPEAYARRIVDFFDAALLDGE